jgi:hypothetical protein
VARGIGGGLDSLLSRQMAVLVPTDDRFVVVLFALSGRPPVVRRVIDARLRNGSRVAERCGGRRFASMSPRSRAAWPRGSGSLPC